MTAYYDYSAPSDSFLYHHGIKGQKWGVRRFQNLDRSLTPAGKERYGRGTSEGDGREKKGLNINSDTAKKVAKTALAVAGTAAVAYGGYKLANSAAAKEFATSMKMRASLAKNATFLSLRTMDEPELDKQIARLAKEADLRKKTYEALTSSADPKTQMAINTGRKVTEAALTGIVSYAGYAALSKRFDSKQAAGYVFPNPNKKQK